MVVRMFVPLVVACCFQAATVSGQVARYNPYADAEDPLPPVAADGTLHWGVFYKSPAIQQNFERLWNMGSCRGTSRAVVEPVKRNKLVIDLLPESEHRGLVQGATGTIAGGMIAFVEAGVSEPMMIQLHPAGVSRLSVRGPVPVTTLRPGLVVRLMATVDARGRIAQPVTEFELVTPAADFMPDEVVAERQGQIVGRIVRLQSGVMTLQVPTGRLRKIVLTVDPSAAVTVDAAQVDLVSPGDAVAVSGRLWTGEGSLGAGTLFASEVTVTKPAVSAPPAAMVGGP